MQNARSIILHPMPFALLLSVVAHAALLASRGIHVPPRPTLETGKTVVQLTLKAAAPSMPEPQPQPLPAPVQIPAPVEPAPAPAPQPVPEPVAETPEPAPASIEQDAAMEADKGVTAEASISGMFRPAYPRISRRRGEEGVVALSIQVLANGSAGRIEVLRSSGYHRLDDAAVEGARHTTFQPALLLGRAIDSTLELSYIFRLTDD